MKMKKVQTYSTDRKGSLHLIAKALYLDRCSYDNYAYYNVALLFCRFRKGDNKLVSRYRILGITYVDYENINEFNRVYMALNNGVGVEKPPEKNTYLMFDLVGSSLSYGINNYEANVYVNWKSQGTYSSIQDISLRAGEPLIRRTPEMDFPDSFYQKYGEHFRGKAY